MLLRPGARWVSGGESGSEDGKPERSRVVGNPVLAVGGYLLFRLFDRSKKPAEEAGCGSYFGRPRLEVRS